MRIVFHLTKSPNYYESFAINLVTSSAKKKSRKNTHTKLFELVEIERRAKKIIILETSNSFVAQQTSMFDSFLFCSTLVCFFLLFSHFGRAPFFISSTHNKHFFHNCNFLIVLFVFWTCRCYDALSDEGSKRIFSTLVAITLHHNRKATNINAFFPTYNERKQTSIRTYDTHKHMPELCACVFTKCCKCFWHLHQYFGWNWIVQVVVRLNMNTNRLIFNTVSSVGSHFFHSFRVCVYAFNDERPLLIWHKISFIQLTIIALASILTQWILVDFFFFWFFFFASSHNFQYCNFANKRQSFQH